MKYFVKDLDGQELGPYEQKEIEQYILEGRINGKTEVRTDLLPTWNKLSNVTIFTKALAAAPPPEADEEEIARQNMTLGDKIAEWLCLNYKEVEPSEQNTAFQNRPIPHPGGPILRYCAGLTDFAILLLIMLVMVWFGIRELHTVAINTTAKPPPEAVAETAATDADKDKAKSAKAEEKDTKSQDNPKDAKAKAGDKETETAEAQPPAKANNAEAAAPPTINDDSTKNYDFGSTWIVASTREKYLCIGAKEGQAQWVKAEAIGSMLHWYLAFAILLFALYYGFALGYFAQTIGMWFWGLFIIRKDNKEVYFFRAALFALLVPWLGWLVLLTGWIGGWGIHDHLTGVKILRITPRSRY